MARADRSSRTTRLASALGLAMTVLAGSAEAACPPDAAPRLYADARRAFEEKRFDDSIALLHQAYTCDPNPTYLANIARSHEEANRPKDALGAWRTYLEAAPGARDRVLTEGRISALSKVVEDLDRLQKEKEEAQADARRAEAAARQRLLTPEARPSAPSRHVSAGAWIVTATGAGGLVAGIALGLHANSTHASAVSEPNVNVADGLQDTARTFATAASVAFVAGGAVAGAGLTWIGIDLFRRPASTLSPSVALVPTWPTMALRVRF